MRPLASALLAGALIVPSSALAYDEEVHSFLVRSALSESGLDVPAPPIPPDAPAAIRRSIDLWARTSTDAALAAEWTRRYPTPESFDAWAEKELLLFAPEANVLGIDRLPDARPAIIDVIE